MMCQTRRMTKTVKNMRLRSHQSYLLWSQESSLRGIKTSPLLLPRWPIRNLCLRYRSCPRPTTSTSTSTNPGSEPYTTLDHPGPPHRARTTPPQTPAQVARDPPLPLRLCLQVSCFHQYHDMHSSSCFLPVDHCNTKIESSIANH